MNLDRRLVEAGIVNDLSDESRELVDGKARSLFPVALCFHLRRPLLGQFGEADIFKRSDTIVVAGIAAALERLARLAQNLVHRRTLALFAAGVLFFIFLHAIQPPAPALRLGVSFARSLGAS